MVGRVGAGMMLVNPLGAPAPVVPQAASPYYPSTRRFRNPTLPLRGGRARRRELGPQLAQLVCEAHGLNTMPRLDRDRVFALKQAALRTIWGNGECGRALRGLSPRAWSVAGSLRRVLCTGREVRAGLAHLADRVSPTRQFGRGPFCRGTCVNSQIPRLAAMADRPATLRGLGSNRHYARLADRVRPRRL